jgi:hypothetical protein
VTPATVGSSTNLKAIEHGRWCRTLGRSGKRRAHPMMMLRKTTKRREVVMAERLR